VVAGSHLEKNYGLSAKEIIADKNKIDFSFKTKLKSNNSISTLFSMSESLKKFTLILKKINPNIVIILGDRYEMLMAAISAMIQNYPIAHIHGGETTKGAFDDSIRHAISKMANLHFVSHDLYKKRLIELGENSKKIFNFGGLGAENISICKFLSKKQIEEKYKFRFYKKNIVVAFHPVTREPRTAKKYFLELVKALEKFPSIRFIFTYPNIDPENIFIIKIIEKCVKKNKNFISVKSFGQKFFFSVLKNIDGMIGNSSSGILEAPSFKISTINIGNRQKGRAQGNSIINCKPVAKSIEKCIRKIYSKNFKKKIKLSKNIYFKKNTSKNISNTLINFPLRNLAKK